jgi:hypothetical protein
MLVAFATNCTLEVTVWPFEGLVTTTVANAGAAVANVRKKSAREKTRMGLPLTEMGFA